MPHDETGSGADLSAALTPAVRALASGERSDPQPADRVGTFSYATVLRNEPPGWWGTDVWEQVNNYKGAVALAVRPIMTAFRGAEYKVLRRKPKSVQKAQGGRHKWSRDDAYEPVEDHPLCDIIRAPGGPQGAWSFGYECAYAYLQYLLTGNAAFWFPANAEGKPCQMFALSTTSVQVAFWPGATANYPQGAYRVLPYATGAGFGSMGYMTSTALLPGEQVRILREPDPLSRQLGRSRLRMGAMEIDVLKSINEFRWNYFDTGVALDTIVTLPGASEEEAARVREMLTQKHGGARNARRVAVFAGSAGIEGGKGATVTNGTPNAKDLDFPQGFEQALSQVLAFFGVPKILAGFDDSSNYATYIGQRRRFYQECLLPEFAGLSEFLTKHLAEPWSDEPGEYVIVAEPEVPEDLEQEQQERQFAVQNGLITVNEYRKSTGREEVPDGDLPASVYQQKVQQTIAPPPQPGMDPNAPPGAEQAAPMPPDGDDSEQGTQDATLQAALAALGMGGTDAGPEDEPPVMKAAAPVNKPGGGRKVRAEGERWTGADGKQWTKKNGKIVPAPQQSGTGGPGASAQPPGAQRYPSKFNEAITYGYKDDRDADDKAFGKDIRAANKQVAALKQKLAEAEAKLPDNHPVVKQARAALQAATEKANAARAKADSLKGGSSAGEQQSREQIHAAILKTKGAKAFGFTAETLAKMHPSAVDTIAAQLGIKPPEQHYAKHAAAVQVTPRSQPVLQRAGEWADAMAAKHAARVAQRLGIRPELAQRILAKAIRQIAEHALKNGGKASGTLTVGGQSVRLGVGAKTGTNAAQPKPPTPEQVGLADADGRPTNPDERTRPRPGVAKAMNSLSDPEGGFLVPPPGNMPRRKRKRRSVWDVVQKAFDESKVKRDHGKFASKEGESGKPAEPSTQSFAHSWQTRGSEMQKAAEQRHRDALRDLEAAKARLGQPDVSAASAYEELATATAREKVAREAAARESRLDLMAVLGKTGMNRVQSESATGTRWTDAEHHKRKEAFDFIEHLLSREHGSVPRVWLARPDNGRAYHAGTHVYVSRNDDAATYVHELGHHLEEHIPGLAEKARAFLESRVGNEEPVNLRAKFGASFAADELGRADDFGPLFDDPASAYYVGKVYDHGATEVLSMGLELMFRDPKRFARTDPDYFNFVLDALQPGRAVRP